MLDLTAEQQHLAKIVHDYACQFPLTEHGDIQLLQGCCDYMQTFKQVMDSTSNGIRIVHCDTVHHGSICSGEPVMG
jgi:hypothetical protein